MRRLFTLFLAGAAACAGTTPAQPPVQPMAAPAPAPAPAPAEAAAAPQFKLNETAADRLGTSPPGLGLPVGQHAPDATLLDLRGKEQRLSALYAQAPTFVVFYRGGWCPFCNLQLHDLTEAKPQFDQRGIKLIAISVDRPTEEAKTQAKHGVPFPMLSDSKLVAHRAFNVLHVPAAGERDALKGYGIDLEAYSGETHGTFAVPAIFLLDRQGVIRFVHIDEDYKTRPSVTQMLAVADAALAGK